MFATNKITKRLSYEEKNDLLQSDMGNFGSFRLDCMENKNWATVKTLYPEKINQQEKNKTCCPCPWYKKSKQRMTGFFWDAAENRGGRPGSRKKKQLPLKTSEIWWQTGLSPPGELNYNCTKKSALPTIIPIGPFLCFTGRLDGARIFK